jgi:hypothetical protein
MASQPKTIKQQMTQIECCIQNCLECGRACLETISHCLLKGGEYSTEKHIRLLQDCAEICQTSANFIIRNSDLHLTICSACAEVCLRCAESCQRFGDDDRMKTCAEACRRCAESCQLMVANATETGMV